MAMNIKTVAFGSGLFFISLATFTQGLLPMMEPQSRTDKVTRVVRTDHSDLKWMVSTATDYTPEEAAGRKTYIKEGCIYCHSQYIRPVAGESKRWGPVTQAGEYAFDTPHLFSTRRIGPDLSRVGMKYSDEWHLAHFWDPRMIVPDSIMPRFKELFDSPDQRIEIVTDSEGNRTLAKNAITEKYFDFSKSADPTLHIKLTPNPDGLVFVPELGKYPIIWTPNNEPAPDSLELAVITDDLSNLIAYLQKLGMNRGKWRDKFESQNTDFAQASLEKSPEWIAHGKGVYERRCAGCHGAEGDGNGPAATFMYKDRPRDFQSAVYKFRSTGSDSLPTDADLLRTLVRGVRGTSMPSWHMLPEKDRVSVVQYIKFVLSVDRSDPESPYAIFEEEEADAPLHITRAPEVDDDVLAMGREIWRTAKCWECHGDTGAGDGEKAAGLKDDKKFPIVPANLQTGQYKSGSSVRDIFRTVSNGLSGTPMPSYGDSFDEEERWALSYYVMSLSAYTDALTLEKLGVSDETREALNDTETVAATSDTAYSPEIQNDGDEASYGGNAWAARRGMEVVGSIPPAAPEIIETLE